MDRRSINEVWFGLARAWAEEHVLPKHSEMSIEDATYGLLYAVRDGHMNVCSPDPDALFAGAPNVPFRFELTEKGLPFAEKAYLKQEPPAGTC